jgi:ABC-2 type transport system ATP-binding protein
VANPPIFILDEPTAGLDPNQIREVRALIRELRGDHTVLVSTHILSEIEALCDRALVIHRGRLVAEGAIGEIKARSLDAVIEIVARDPEGKAEAQLRALPEITRIDVSREAAEGGQVVRLDVHCPNAERVDALSEAIAQRLVEANIGVRALRRHGASLEDAFAELTREATQSDESLEQPTGRGLP